MSILKSLTFTAVPDRSHDPIANRRAKLAERLEEQKKLLQNPSYDKRRIDAGDPIAHLADDRRCTTRKTGEHEGGEVGLEADIDTLPCHCGKALDHPINGSTIYIVVVDGDGVSAVHAWPVWLLVWLLIGIGIDQSYAPETEVPDIDTGERRNSLAAAALRIGLLKVFIRAYMVIMMIAAIAVMEVPVSVICRRGVRLGGRIRLAQKIF